MDYGPRTSSMHILVIGGAGYIGSHAVRLFLDRGHDVWVYDSLALGHRKSVPAERLIVGDLNESHRLDQVLVEKRIDAAGARPDGSIGEDHDPETHLIPLVIFAATGRRPQIEVFGTDYPTPDGTCIRDYIHVDDLAEAHLLALEKLQPGQGMQYNLGTGRGYSVREVIRTVEEVTGKKVPVKEGLRRAGDPPALVAAAGKIQKELGWKPRYTELRPIV